MEGGIRQWCLISSLVHVIGNSRVGRRKPSDRLREIFAATLVFGASERVKHSDSSFVTDMKNWLSLVNGKQLCINCSVQQVHYGILIPSENIPLFS